MRVAHITRQTLGFYRESTQPELIDLPSLIQSVLKLYSNKFNVKNIAVELDFGECPCILGVSGELRQVVSNLISNAVDAVSENGTIRIKTQSIEDGSGTGVRIVIEDDGPGVSDGTSGPNLRAVLHHQEGCWHRPRLMDHKGNRRKTWRLYPGWQFYRTVGMKLPAPPSPFTLPVVPDGRNGARLAEHDPYRELKPSPHFLTAWLAAHPSKTPHRQANANAA